MPGHWPPIMRGGHSLPRAGVAYHARPEFPICMSAREAISPRRATAWYHVVHGCMPCRVRTLAREDVVILLHRPSYSPAGRKGRKIAAIGPAVGRRYVVSVTMIPAHPARLTPLHSQNPPTRSAAPGCKKEWGCQKAGTTQG